MNVISKLIDVFRASEKGLCIKNPDCVVVTCRFSADKEHIKLGVPFRSLGEQIDLGMNRGRNSIATSHPRIWRFSAARPSSGGRSSRCTMLPALVDASRPVQEILASYPRPAPSEIEVASIFTKANPQEAVPDADILAVDGRDERIDEIGGIGSKPNYDDRHRRQSY